MSTSSSADVANLDDATTPAPTSSRRNMLRLAGAAAIGATAAAVVGTQGASANIGDPMELGNAGAGGAIAGTAHQSTAQTRYDWLAVPAGVGFLYEAVGATIVTNSQAEYPSALGGFTQAPNSPTGVYGRTNQAGGNGVAGKATAATGTGVRGEGATGVVATGVSTGLSASATAGTGIVSTTSDAGSYAVLAFGVGGGVFGVGGPYAIAAGATTRANLYLQPNNNFLFGTTPKTVPTTRTDDHKAGEVECVDGDLWFCTVSGTPGTWRRLTGNGAGTGFNSGFNAVTPGRLYDSRGMTPAGPLAANATRDIILRDRVDATNYAVNAANYVPAGATALAVNVTVVNTVGSGFLSVNPKADNTVHAATINWSASGQILNNGVNITLGGDREVTVIAGGSSGSQTDFVIDVTGYYL